MAAHASDTTLQAAIEAEEHALLRELHVAQARDDLLAYTKYSMPDPNDDTPGSTRYSVQPHHKLLAEALMKVERGRIMRLCISIPPQFGKSELISRKFPAWCLGRNPWRNIMMGTYNDDMAKGFGGDVRSNCESAFHKECFPGFDLAKGSKAKDFMMTTSGGKASFLGRGGSGTGKPADIFLIDDPIKDDQEAQSDTIREQVWQWFTKVAMTRCHKHTPIVIVHTRWHEDDLIGRLCDPDHPDHDPDIAKDWVYINIPAILEPDYAPIAHALGLPVGGSLWEERFSLKHLQTARKLNPRGFEALYQGKPSPDDGDYFKADNLVEYRKGELPTNLRFYAASDHATDTKKENDPSCLMVAGVDEAGEIWVLPDLVWERMPTDQVVENMVGLMKRHRPIFWWAEADAIGKSIGPFLRRRMKEENVFVAVDDQRPIKDKVARAQSIMGMTAFKRVHFPSYAPWWQKAKRELLKFPNGAHDDFVDALAWLGLGLDREVGKRQGKKEDKVVVVGSYAWVKAQANREREAEKRRKASGGW